MDYKYNFLLILLLLLTLIIIQFWQEEHSTLSNISPIITNNINEKLSEKKIFNEKKNKYVILKTDVLYLKINVLGGDIEEAKLLTYYDKLNSKKPFILLRTNKDFLYQAQSGIVGKSIFDNEFSGNRPIFTTLSDIYIINDNQKELIVPFTYINNKGIKYIKTFILKRGQFCVDVICEIINNSSKNLELSFFGQLKQSINLPKKQDNYTMSEYFTISNYRGAAYSANNIKYKKYNFNDIKQYNLSLNVINRGWIAMLQQYFAVAWIPNLENFSSTFYTRFLNNEIAVIGFKSEKIKVNPNENKLFKSSLWIGPEIQENMSAVASYLDLVVDYGYLWFISQPLFKLLKFINYYVNNWGTSIIIITFIVRMLMYPLTKAQYTSMFKIRMLQPKILDIKDKLRDDKHRQNQEIIALYKSEKVNPLGGCLPVIIQMPIFLALYYMLSCSIELRHSSFIFWINDLSSRDQYYILPIIMGITSFFIQKFSYLYNNSDDLIQQKISNFIPFIFTLFFLWFPSGLVLYYIINNVVTVLQQFFIYKKLDNIK